MLTRPGMLLLVVVLAGVDGGEYGGGGLSKARSAGTASPSIISQRSRLLVQTSVILTTKICKRVILKSRFYYITTRLSTRFYSRVSLAGELRRRLGLDERLELRRAGLVHARKLSRVKVVLIRWA